MLVFHIANNMLQQMWLYYINNKEKDMEYYDTHAHYDDRQFDSDREDVLDKIYKSGVTRCINVGCNIETSTQAIEIAKKHDFIYAMCGMHPNEIPQTEDKMRKDIEKIKELATKQNKVVAIGEIGLDYHYDGFDKEMQQKAFIKQIELANELNLPISIHTRDSIDDTIAILRNYKIINGGVLHCCPFNRELVKHGLEQGLYIAFGGTCTFKNAKNAEEIVNMVPLDKILIETDSPYLSPDPYRGNRNDSSYLKYVVEKIACFKGLTPQEIAKITYENAENLFKEA